MDPVTLVAALNGAISLVQVLEAEYDRRVQAGEISAEVQLQRRNAYLATRWPDAFKGPEMELSRPEL